MSKYSNITVKRLDVEDVADLAPILVGIVVWYLTTPADKKAALNLLPALAAVVAWLLMKGLRYVPR